jgi:hypothetical protein
MDDERDDPWFSAGNSDQSAHPDSPAGGTGPGFARASGPIGGWVPAADGLPHPHSPAGRSLVLASAGQVQPGTQIVAPPAAPNPPQFILDHLADAKAVAKALNTTPAAILAVAGLESTWGTSRFAREGNNFFGLHAPQPFEVGQIKILHGPGSMSKFASFERAGAAFAKGNGRFIAGLTDPTEIATALQDRGKFGIDIDTGQKLPNYVRSVANTINNVQRRLDGLPK